jgi:LacI family transcriptional regulator
MVHTSTASRALNGETRSMVNAETVERVLAVAAHLGYRPNAVARGLKTNRSQSIGVLVPDLLNPVIPPIVRGIEARFAEAGFTVLLGNASHSDERERLYVEAMLAHLVEGLITATAHENDAALGLAVKSGLPVVLVNRSVEDGRFSAAIPDDHLCISLAIDHLVGLGHTQIAHVAGPPGTTTGARRRESFEATLRKHRLESDPRLIVTSNRYTEDEGHRCSRQLIASGRPFTAIVAANDMLALGCLDALADSAMRCPDDVSVVGCNDMPFTDRFSPPLTTINISHDALGAAAAELLLERLDSPQAPNRTVVIEPSLVVRESTAPPLRGRS